MKPRLNLWLRAAAFGLCVACLSTPLVAGEKPDATGSWKWSFTTQSGQTYETTLKLKQEGEKLSGVVVGRDGAETPIADGKIKDAELSFKVTRERSGQTVTTTYKGKLSGDTIKGTTETERDGQTRSREWEAKRAGAGATGTWTWTFTPPGGQSFEATLKLKQEGDNLTGAMVRGDRETPIKEGKVKDGEVSFQVTRERDGQTFTTKYQGKLSADTIKGTAETERDGQTRSREWEAKRAGANATGTWTWTFTPPGGQSFEATLKLKQDGDNLTGVMVRGDRETPIQEGKIKDGEISFQVTRERDGQTFTTKYQGKLSADAINGKITSNFGGEERTFDWDAKRVKEEK